MIKMRKFLLRVVLPFSFVALGGLYYYDVQKLTELPRFRTVSDPFKVRDDGPIPTRKGLDTLNISGSRRPTQTGLARNLQNVKMPIYNFDLQVDAHYFIKGSPEQWYGYKRVSEVGIDGEIVRLRHYIRRIIHTGKLYHDASDAQTEQQMSEDLGYHYVGISQIRHRLPTAEQIDLFMDTIHNIPQPAWIHFHCNAGRSRTTIAMILFDIMKNGKEVSVEDIVRRHYLLGSEDLFDTEVWHRSTYTRKMLTIRKEFILAFYRYVNDSEGYGVSSWTDWSTKHGVYADSNV
jgi:hypothetical protein